ncbi:MAG: MogA/MoaB family molybdenum cofactor biosynthesis protein [Nitrososphaerota archaeon]|nr:MogA/MoaB family molybdenum cofactor biosynthesis protein [Nitrososphaerota archaeon]
MSQHKPNKNQQRTGRVERRPTTQLPSEHGHHDKDVFTNIHCSLITVSTSRYEGLQKGKRLKDESGDMLAKLLKGAGHKVASRTLVPDSIAQIRSAVLSAARLREVKLIVLVGGTGMSRTDVTYDAIRPLFKREMLGFGEAFRSASISQVGLDGMFTRAALGITDDDKVLVSLPGSINGVRTGAELLVKIIPHLMSFI